jgi:predicted neuraminidase
MLMVQMKAARAEISQQLLSHYINENEEFPQNIMTADKMWVHHSKQETKHQSITKVHLQKRKFKTQVWEEKVKATVFGM